MKIALIGTFDVDNYGDCLFPYIIQKVFEKLIKESVQLQLFSPTSNASKMGEAIDLLSLPGQVNDDFLNKLGRYDLVMLAGGDTVWSGEKRGTYSFLDFNEMSAGMRLWIWPFVFQNKYKKPGVIFAPGVGKLSVEAAQILEHDFSKLSYFSLRDKVSAEKINSSVQVDLDIAFSLPLIYPKNELEVGLRNILPTDLSLGSYIVCQISHTYLDGGFEEYLDALLCIAEKYKKKILLLPLCLFLGDEYLMLKVKAILSEKGAEVFYVNPVNVEKILVVLACGFGYIGTSLHGSITSYAYGNKTVVISGGAETKHKGVLSVASAEDIVVRSFSEIVGAWDNEVNGSGDRASLVSKACKNSFSKLISSCDVNAQKAMHFSLSDVNTAVQKENAQYGVYDKFKIRIHKCMAGFKKIQGLVLRLKIWLKLNQL